MIDTDGLVGGAWALAEDPRPLMTAQPPQWAQPGLAGLFMVPKSQWDRKPYRTSGAVAIVGATGVFTNARSWWSGASYEQVAEAVQAADGDDGVKAILLHVNSPGGTSAGLTDLLAALRMTEKPVHAYIQGQAMSAGCLLLSVCTQVTISPAAAAGALGAILVMRRMPPRSDQGDLLELRIVSRSTPAKDWGAAFGDDENAEVAKADLQKYLDEVHEAMMAEANRGGRTMEDHGGKTFTGDAAVTAGLADQVGGQMEALAAAEAAGLEQERQRMTQTQANADALAEARREAAAAERERAAAIRALAGPDDIKDRCIADGRSVGDSAVDLNAALSEAAAGAAVLNARGEHTAGSETAASGGEQPARKRPTARRWRPRP